MRWGGLMFVLAFSRCGPEPIDRHLLGDLVGWIEIQNDCCPSLLFPHQMQATLTGDKVRLTGVCIDCSNSPYCVGPAVSAGPLDLTPETARVAAWTGDATCPTFQIIPPNCPSVTLHYTTLRAEVVQSTVYISGAGQLSCGTGSLPPPAAFRMSFKANR